jgi:Arc/MetJ-type ribon-helix-helix transcriptional regulator
VEKTRVSVTLTRPYLDALDRPVKQGVYRGKGELVLESLRLLLRGRGIELVNPYYN